MKLKRFNENIDNIDPFDEEEWDEKDIDFELTRPGLRIWHVEGNSLESDDNGGMQWTCNVIKYSNFLKEKNPDMVEIINENPSFYAGFVAGITLMEEKQKLKNRL